MPQTGAHHEDRSHRLKTPRRAFVGRTQNRAQRRSGPAAEASAKVALSPAASSLALAKGDAQFDTAKVERIAQAIRDGKFKVNAEVIADRLIVNAEELLGRKPN